MNADAYKKIMTLSRIACFIALQCALPVGNTAFAREYFNPALLGIDGPGKELTDLSAFEEGIGQMPGTYRVDVIVNKSSAGVHDVNFVMQKDTTGNTTLQPCFSVDSLREFGIRTDAFPNLAGHGDCANLAAIPQASAEFAFERQQLRLSIPQAAVDSHARGYVAPERLDEGINALLLNYSFSGANTEARRGDMIDSDSYYLSLRPGLNIGPWRIRNYSTWNRNVNGDSADESWDSLYTYAQRNIIALKSQLTLGDSTAPSELFDSVPFRGVQLASDDDMLPDSLRGYAPVVRGIARTNAQVIIKQNGYTIYQSYVSPGAFEITDMYPTGSSGDLDVTIKEADGSEQHQTVAFASLPILQREGRLKYSVTSGQYRPYESDIDKKMFTQATLIYGLPAGFTVYGGGQFSQHYKSLLTGLGKNLGELGAVSVDGTQAWSTQKDQDKESGQSWRIRYSKNILETGTNISISGYRYSTSGYYTLPEVLDTWRDDESQNNNDRRRNRAEFQLNQNIGEHFGSLSLTAMSEDYWNSDRQMRSIGVGYSNSWAGVTYNLNYSYNRNTTDTDSDKIYDEDQVFSLSINVPLDRWLSNSYASYSLNTSKRGDTSHNVGLNGSLLEDRNLNWNVQQSETNHGEGNGGYASLDYQGTYARLNTAYSYDHDQKRVNYGIEGGVVAHAHGVTLSQALGETSALVEAPGAGGVTVSNQTGVRTDFRGYTVVPYVTPYRESTVSLDTATLPDGADVELTSKIITPTRGAIVRAHFDTRVGKRVLMTLTRSNGEAVPFGALVTDADNPSGSIVGDGGQVYLTGMANSGTARAKWGQGPNQQCQIHYRLPDAEATSGVVEMQTVCQ
ncbi:fimbrial biogenesis outer membrane usher protein [Salmonella enterica subsp. enterica serovar Abony]|nr:fimbrial biogenesis outer membrane usher protein [Salmonella enterica subsp. enterica serovar Abony]EBY6398003.1 fimbrial biogenesis outer membrane usher protein [Salmonella enterica subsp. enterica serovar Abony]EDH3763821.1 fimbria/pilus outer membrane usher protein [Salmonella enterica subsp. enterica]EHK4820141.1 fimbrial biogenesis outer membrane usher protein [Salmonella enterica subsp. enterica serovar Abony]HBD1787558.1 fimbrial biogenesis outer membrane usher protein [Salmonella ent